MAMRDERDDPQPKRLIYQMRERVEQARSRYNRERKYGSVSDETHLLLVEVVVEYHDVLYEFRNVKPVKGDFPDISDIREKMGQQATVYEEAPGDTTNQRPATKPAALTIDRARLESAITELNDTAFRLGFSAAPDPERSGGARLSGTDIADARFAGNSDFADSAFYQSLLDDIEGQREGGAIVVIDAEDARTGVGKTSAAVAFAKYVSQLFGYDLKERDLVLSGQEYLDLYEKQPGEDQPSVAVWDEAVGAGSGDARRAMAQDNVDLGRAWQIMRTRRVVTFVTLPDWGDLDSRLQKLADYRLWCRRDIGNVQAYEVGTTFEGGDIRTRGLGPGEGAEPITFPDMKEIEDRHYLALKAKKDELIESGELDADALREQQSEDKPDSDDTGTDLHALADEVADDIDDFISVNSTNKMEYVDGDLIQMEYDLSTRQARKVKKLVERMEVAP
jgi:hypothetical protein